MDYEAQKQLFSASHDSSPFFSKPFYIYFLYTCVRQSAPKQLTISFKGC